MALTDRQTHEAHLLIAFCSLMVPLMLYLGRSLDDNRLTSWQWVFGATDPGLLFLLLLVITPLLWLLACRLPVYCRPMHLVVVAFMVCLLFLDTPEVIVDASRYFVQAKMLSVHGAGYFFREWGREIFAWTDLPLMSFLYGLLFMIFGEIRLVVQLCNATLFALTAYLVYMLGQDLWDEEVGLLGGFLLLGFPFLYTQVPLMLVDVGTMFFLLLAMVTLLRALTRGGVGRLTLASLALVALFFVKYSAWLLLTGLVPIFIYSLAGGWRPVVGRALLVALPSLVCVALVSLPHWQVMVDQLALLNSYQRPGLRRWSESLASTFLFQTHPLLTAGLLYSAFRAWRKRDLRFLVVSYLVFLLLVVLEIRRIRYSLPVFPLVALLAAYGLRDIGDRQVRRHLALVIVGSSLLLARGAFLPFLKTIGERNIQDAGLYLNGLAEDRVRVFALSEPNSVLDLKVEVPLLDLFTHKQIRYESLPPGGALPERVKKSALRFTWEFNLPALYIPHSIDSGPVVVISNSLNDDQPPQLRASIAGLSPIKSFTENNGIFQNRTCVVVYGPRIMPP